MIDAKELRIGNLVYFEKPVNVQLGEIKDIKNHIVSLSSYGIYLIECDEKTKVNPISLTEEWLLNKIGYRKKIDYFRGEGKFIKKGNITLYDDAYGYLW